MKETPDNPVMYRYSVVGPNNSTDVVILSYNHLWRLVDMTFSQDCTDVFIHTAKMKAPVRVVPCLPPAPSKGAAITRLPKQFDEWLAAKCSIKDISNFDLSFEKFWRVYNTKVGNMKRVRSKWDSMPELDRIMALGCINRMRNYYDGKGWNMPIPETYLNGRRWENQFN